MDASLIPLWSAPVYVYAPTPPLLPVSVEDAEGTTFILMLLLVLLCGFNAALYAVYLYLFCGNKRDSLVIQAAAFVSVSCSIVLAAIASKAAYHRTLVELFTQPGFDINTIEWFVPLFHAFQAIPVAIGQVYFILRIAKLFDTRRASIRTSVCAAMAGVTAQFVLMVWFGMAFWTVKYKSHLLNPHKRHWIHGIISAWAVMFILLEVAMTLTTMARLAILRRQTSMDGARRVLFNLAVYSLQGQVLLTTCSFTSVYLFQHSATGWYSPLYLTSGGLYTLVLLANLIYRSAVSNAMTNSRMQPSVRTQEYHLSHVNTFHASVRPDPESSTSSVKDAGAAGDLERPQTATTIQSVHPRHFVHSRNPVPAHSRASAPLPVMIVTERSTEVSSPPPFNHRSTM